MPALDISGNLMRVAESLRPVGKPFISVLRLAEELGVVSSIRLHKSSSSPAAQLDLQTQPPKIILYRAASVEGEREIKPWDEKSLSVRERFSVAHELGHWIMFDRFGISPKSDKDTYWEHERAINAFAGYLLAPDWLAAHWLKTVREGTPVPPFALRSWAASECQASEEVVAKALARNRSSVGFLKVLSARSSKGVEVLQVLCSAHGKALQLPKERSHIESSELCSLLKAHQTGEATLTQIRLGLCSPQDLCVAWRHTTASQPPNFIWLSLALKCEMNVDCTLPTQLSLEI